MERYTRTEIHIQRQHTNAHIQTHHNWHKAHKQQHTDSQLLLHTRPHPAQIETSKQKLTQMEHKIQTQCTPQTEH